MTNNDRRDPTATDSVVVAPAALGQVAYHLRCSAGFALDGATESSAGHAVLAWALLDAVGGAALRDAVAALDLPDIAAAGGDVPVAMRRMTEELALQCCGHFTSEGRHDLAQLYQDAYAALGGR
jgi:hypothetical protein